MNKLFRNDQSGFTLLEVMIAMAIMLIAFSSILMVQSNSLQAAFRARQVNTVVMLLKQKLIETEFDIDGKTFDEVKKEEGGEFKEPFQDFSWKREVKELKFPNLTSIATAQGEQAAKESNSSSTTSGGAAGNVADQMGKLVTSYLSKAIREIVVTVSWKLAKGTQKVSISMYWVDLNRAFDLSE